MMRMHADLSEACSRDRCSHFWNSSGRQAYRCLNVRYTVLFRSTIRLVKDARQVKSDIFEARESRCHVTAIQRWGIAYLYMAVTTSSLSEISRSCKDQVFAVN